MLVSASTYLDALFLLLGDNSDRTRALVREFMTACEKDEKRQSIITSDDELIETYKALIKTVIAENITQDNGVAAKILLVKVKSNETLKDHPVIRDLLTDILTAEEPISAKQIDEYLKRVRNSLLCAELEDQNRKIFSRTQKAIGIRDADEQEAELLRIKAMVDDSAKLIESRQNSSDTSASETYVSLSDEASIVRALNVFMDRNVTNVIRTGLQGLNKALGKRGGMGLGESFVFGACSHNYKSGMLVSIMLWAIIYNKIVVEPGKKAMIYFVSLENEVNQNLMDVFKTLYGRIEKKHVDISTMSVDFITNWLRDYFKQFDTELFIDRYQPHDFTYSKFVKRYNAFVEMNYQIIVFDLDYMSEARGLDPHDTVSAQGRRQMIGENYIKFMNHAKSCGYLMVTGHQLNRDADTIAGSHRYAVKKFNPSMMADSSDVFRTIDGLFFMHLETNIDGFKFLTCINRKNRGCNDTPEKDKFFAYAFTEFGIEDDLDGPAKYVTDIDAWSIDGGVRDDQIVEAAMF